MLNKIRKQIWQSHGYAVAEFAITLPVLISVFSLCIWVISLGVAKLEIESISNNVARTIARGETISESNLPTGLNLEVSEFESIISVKAKLIRTIPLLNKKIEISANAKSVSEIYNAN